MKNINRVANLKNFVRLFGKDGRQIGMVTLSDAKKLAKKQSAILIKIAETNSESIWSMVDRPKRGGKPN
jgi:translation initiation factor IF-3